MGNSADASANWIKYWALDGYIQSCDACNSNEVEMWEGRGRGDMEGVAVIQLRALTSSILSLQFDWHKLHESTDLSLIQLSVFMMANWKSAAEAKRQLLESLNQKKPNQTKTLDMSSFFPLSHVLPDFSRERKKVESDIPEPCRAIWTQMLSLRAYLNNQMNIPRERN